MIVLSKKEKGYLKLWCTYLPSRYREEAQDWTTGSDFLEQYNYYLKSSQLALSLLLLFEAPFRDRLHKEIAALNHIGTDRAYHIANRLAQWPIVITQIMEWPHQFLNVNSPRQVAKHGIGYYLTDDEIQGRLFNRPAIRSLRDWISPWYPGPVGDVQEILRIKSVLRREL